MIKQRFLNTLSQFYMLNQPEYLQQACRNSGAAVHRTSKTNQDLSRGGAIMGTCTTTSRKVPDTTGE